MVTVAVALEIFEADSNSEYNFEAPCDFTIKVVHGQIQ
jgi:hypothetical protein